MAAGAEPLDGPSLEAARGWARELGIHLLAGSIAERGKEKAFNTSVLIGPDGEDLAVYRKIHMFDVEAGGVEYRESEHEEAGTEIVTAPLGDLSVGLSVCYDLRFPELYRILAVRGARLIAVPSAFTLATGQRPLGDPAAGAGDREPGLRPRPQPGRRGAAPLQLLRALGDRRPLGRAARRRRGRRVLRRRRSRSRRPGPGAPVAALARQPPSRGLRLAAAAGDARLMASSTSKAPAIDKRRQILDAAIRVFARQGFHSTRVADIADEAGVAYGLVYHYFKSKDEVLNELFSERWSLLLAAIEEADRSEATPRAKLEAVAGFIVDSYRHNPELMKVIIVEVTRAANSFGAHPPAGDPPRLRLDRQDRRRRPGAGRLPPRHRPGLRLDVLLRGDRAAALRLDLRPDPGRRRRLRAGKGAGRGDDLRRAGAAMRYGRPFPRRRRRGGYCGPPEGKSRPWTTRSSNDWCGAGC